MEVCDPRSIFAPMKILMVCLGNICRSPLAEGILQQKVQEAGLSWTVDSAGTNGYHTGEPPHHLSQKVALHHGIDISCQRARRFAASDFQQYDMIYALAGDVLSEDVLPTEIEEAHEPVLDVPPALRADGTEVVLKPFMSAK